MKNLYYAIALVLVAGLTACANDNVNEGRNYQYAGREGCSDTLVKPRPAPVPAPVVQPTPCCQVSVPVANCGGCPAKEYTVRTPVKVVYKNTTYRTVYEPRTFESTSFETRPYNRAEVCEGGDCGQMHLISQYPMY